MGAWLIPAALSLGSGLANMFSSSAEARQQKRNIRSTQGQLYENLIDEDELDKLLRTSERRFNASISSLANTTALRTRGVTNAAVVGAAALAPAYGEKFQAEQNIRQGAEERNTNIRTQIAGLEMGQPSEDPVGSFFSGAIPGLTAGLEFSSYLDNLGGLEDDVLEEGLEGTTAPSAPTSSTGFQNPSPFSTMRKPGMGGKVNNRYRDFLGFDQMALNRKLNPFGFSRN
jgi:hypothetical protein